MSSQITGYFTISVLLYLRDGTSVRYNEYYVCKVPAEIIFFLYMGAKQMRLTLWSPKNVHIKVRPLKFLHARRLVYHYILTSN